MSSSRPPETGTELPDRADLPDDDGASAPGFPQGVGFVDDESEDGTSAYAVSAPPPATAQSAPGQERDADDSASLGRRLADARSRVRPWSAWTLRAKLVA